MILDLNYQHFDYDNDILPFIKNGVIIDTSVLKIIFDGIVSARISKKPCDELNKILLFLDRIKVRDK